MQNLFDADRYSGQALLVPGRDWEVEQVPQPANFFGTVRGISRFGLLFSGGLCATLLARLIPAILPGYAIAASIGGAACIIYASLSRRTSDRITAIMIGLLIGAGVVAGSWDAIYAVFSDRSGQKLGVQISIVLLVLGGAVVIERTLSKGGDR